MGFMVGLIAIVIIAGIALILFNVRAVRKISRDASAQADVPDEKDHAVGADSITSEMTEAFTTAQPAGPSPRAGSTRDARVGRPSTRIFEGKSGENAGPSPEDAVEDDVEPALRREPDRGGSHRVTDDEYRDALRELSGKRRQEKPKPQQEHPAISSDHEYREALRSQLKNHGEEQ